MDGAFGSGSTQFFCNSAINAHEMPRMFHAFA
jgi:hypothetical protein